ncbi:MAG: hypothetical protein ACLQFR_23785 [Streptosporangiaceae bacterium]
MQESRLITIGVYPSSTAYEQDDPAFEEQVGVLARDIKGTGATIEQSQPGGKSGPLLELTQIIVTGGVGLSGLLSVLRLWIKRRGDRRIDVEYRSGGVKKKFRLDGHNLSEEALAQLAKDILEQSDEE